MMLDSISRPPRIAAVLGGTAAHKELCMQLKSRGYYTVLIDYLDNPTAKQVADEHIQESTLSVEKVFQIASAYNAELVISSCIDQANVTACHVLSMLGKFFPYSLETAHSFANKDIMKEVLYKHMIPTSKYVVLSSSYSSNWRTLKYPLIVKPADSNGSKGVICCQNEDEVIRSIETALSFSRTKLVIVEEFLEGREIGFDSFIQDGEVHFLNTRERNKIFGVSDEQQIFGSCWPAQLESDQVSKLTKIAQDIASSFSLNNSPLMAQLILGSDGFKVIECAPRIGGGDNHNVIKMSTGFDILAASIDSFIGVKPKLKGHKSSSLIADIYLYATQGLFGSIEGLSELKGNGTIETYDVYRNSGDTIGPELSSNNRVGVFTVAGTSKAELNVKFNRAIQQLEIVGTNGKSIMRREIYGVFG